MAGKLKAIDQVIFLKPLLSEPLALASFNILFKLIVVFS